jgi:hypothetical protein
MAMRTYTIYTKNIGDSPDVWVLLRTAEGEQQLMAEILRLVDNSDPKISIALVRNT